MKGTGEKQLRSMIFMGVFDVAMERTWLRPLKAPFRLTFVVHITTKVTTS